MEWWEYLAPITHFIPATYGKLGIQWGLPPVIAPIVPFLVGALLLFGIFYLGMIIAFSRITSMENVHKPIILISLTMGLLGAYVGAGIVVVMLSNIIYVIGMATGVVIAASVFRAILGGWYAAGATLEEARADYFESLAEKEKAKLKYMKVKGMAINQLYTIVQQLYLKYGDKIDEKTVIRYLKAMNLYDDYIMAYGSERELKKAIRAALHRVKEVAKGFFRRPGKPINYPVYIYLTNKKRISDKEAKEIINYLYELAEALLGLNALSVENMVDMIKSHANTRKEAKRLLKLGEDEVERIVGLFLLNL